MIYNVNHTAIEATLYCGARQDASKATGS